MPSPFPGMNPYLEQPDAWSDFHHSFIDEARKVIAAQVDPDFVVRIDAHIYLHEPPHDTKRFFGRGDVTVAEAGPLQFAQESRTALAAPAVVLLPAVDVERISYLEIRDRRNRRLVTVIELLSPSNKYAGPDREQYLTKRGQVLASRVSYVEIDLLRGGPRMPMEGLPECDYYALVSRVEIRPRADIWPIQLRAQLPVIPVPLDESHPDARLDLQKVLHNVYDAARYESSIYDQSPEPALSPEDAVWAKQFVPAR